MAQAAAQFGSYHKTNFLVGVVEFDRWRSPRAEGGAIDARGWDGSGRVTGGVCPIAHKPRPSDAISGLFVDGSAEAETAAFERGELDHQYRYAIVTLPQCVEPIGRDEQATVVKGRFVDSELIQREIRDSLEEQSPFAGTSDLQAAPLG
ncbi:hypothetical protein M5K25_006012 [Dendrobium thyrsiflorum]|uniref:Uncharacterized protein n=1 Tax=Dendrobium thyrsiflorum TaxID=117978 RepID=A0ABD0VAA4_DENTH